MRWYFPTATILAASVVGFSAPAPCGDSSQQQAAPTQSSAPTSTIEETWRTVLSYQDVQGVLGKEVRSATDENMGRIVDVLVDQTGHVRAAVIDFGGFLGVGSRRVVVDWGALHFTPADQRDRITLDLTRSQVKEVPEYKDGKPVVVIGALGAPPEM